MKTRYQTISKSNQINQKGEYYPDILSFQIKRIILNENIQEVEVNQRYKERFSLLCYDYYGTNYYDDLILWINGIDTVHNLEIGRIIYVPDKRDLDKFLIKNRKKNN